MTMSNVLFMVYTMDTGLGGHIYSLKNISERLECEFKILYFGYMPPKVELKNLTFVDLNKNSIFDCIKISCKEGKNTKVIHSFNEHSYFFSRISSLVNKSKLVLNKCGGKNNKYYPKTKSLVVFSKENYDFFKSKGNGNVYLIPNRVSSPTVLPQSITIDKEKKNIICISRFSRKYKEKIEKSIHLLMFLNKKRNSTTLSIVGTIDDVSVFEQIRDSYGNIPNLFIYTEPVYTSNAQRHIPYFDLTISAGRSLMESFSYGVPAAIVTEDREYPTLINQKNFDTAFYYNFSERTKFECEKELDKKEVFDYFFCDSNSVIDFTKDMYVKYFDSSVIKNRYQEVYLNSNGESFYNFIDIILNGLYIYWIRRNVNISSLTQEY